MDNSVNCYPNPLGQGYWNLTVNDNLIGSEAEIFDAGGKLVFKTIIKERYTEIESRLPGGVYTLRIESGPAFYVKKLVKL